MTPAPFFADIADAPPGAAAHWLTAADGARVRMGVFAKGAKGTVLIFPGRTEYVEKYGPAGREFAARGLGSIAMDWRGQGLADRPLDDPAKGHVDQFEEYQLDVAAMIEALGTLDLPRPWYLVAHSMGGAIGLRSLLSGLPVEAAVFSGPMWNIRMAPLMRPAAWALSAAARPLGFGQKYTPGTAPTNYVQDAEFEGNLLTKDPQMYAWLQSHLAAHPELGLGGPSMTWLNEALREMRELRAAQAPDIPCLAWVGSDEQIVDPLAIHARMASWPDGEVRVVPEAEHEIMMEVPETRTAFYDAAAALFSTAAPTA